MADFSEIQADRMLITNICLVHEGVKKGFITQKFEEELIQEYVSRYNLNLKDLTWLNEA